MKQVEAPAAVYCGMMKYNGLLVNVKVTREKQAEATARMKRLRERIAEITGPVDIGAKGRGKKRQAPGATSTT